MLVPLTRGLRLPTRRWPSSEGSGAAWSASACGGSAWACTSAIIPAAVAPMVSPRRPSPLVLRLVHRGLRDRLVPRRHARSARLFSVSLGAVVAFAVLAELAADPADPDRPPADGDRRRSRSCSTTADGRRDMTRAEAGHTSRRSARTASTFRPSRPRSPTTRATRSSGFCRHPRIGMELFRPQKLDVSRADPCPLFVRRVAARPDTARPSISDLG